ncbi:MAG: MMPL family transporter [Acidimicrobiia bacterium]|nr:MMPL family transporter [Acidimicrobiia bacterium]
MRKTGFTGRLAGVSARHPWRTIAAWVVLVAAAFVLAGNLDSVLTQDGELLTETESETADALIADHFPSDDTLQEYVVVETTGTGAGSDEFDAAVAALVSGIAASENVVSVVSYLDGVPGLVSEDRTAALLITTLDGAEDPDVLVQPMLEVISAANTDTLRVTTAGEGSINAEFFTLAEETMQRGELIGLPVALLILVVVFGAAVAAGIPIILALLAILVAVGMTVVVGQAFDMTFFIVNMITMIGLAVGIDYTLFIVQRFREERAGGHSVLESVVRSGDSASRAVFFSGMTVVIALLGLLIMPDTVMRSLGIGAILVVLASVAAALTLLPAVLGLLGDRVNKGKIPGLSGTSYHEGGGRFWHRITGAVTARPILSMLLAGGLLLAAASPYLGLNTGQNYIESLPEDSEGRHAFTVLAEEFGSGVITSDIVVDVPATEAEIGALVDGLEANPAYGDVTVMPSPDGEIVVVQAVNKLDPSTDEGRAALVDLRTNGIPAAFGPSAAGVYVTGDAAWMVDYNEVINDWTPIIFIFVLGLSFVLLMVVFRSIVVPIKAIIMNLLSVGAAYGLLVAVFQNGFGADLLGFQQTDVIEVWIPLFLFTVLFGLSMDYHIFLLSRIKERYDITGDNDESVAFGLGSTGAIITGAALIMVAVFGGFAMGDLIMLQQMGFGLAVAIILDATIIRSVLVPATMKLLGDRNWYLPSWLSWLPEIHIEGTPDEEPVVVDLTEEERVPALV